MIGEKVLLRVYLDSADRAPHTPAYQRLLHAARQEGLAGATVLHGIMGLESPEPPGTTSWSLSRHVPVILEIVDDGPRLAAFIAGPMDRLMTGGFATLERAAVMMYRHRAQEAPAALGLPGPVAPLSSLPRIEESQHMKTDENGVLLRVFIGESDRHQRKPLYEAVVAKARELGLAGATVLRGSEGFGAHSVVHKTGLLEMSADLPIVIEIVDSEERIKLLLPHLRTMVLEGMVTMENVKILIYQAGAAKG